MRSLPDLVEAIKMEARKNNTSLTKMEVAIGWGNGTIGKWAKSKNYPSLEKLQKIADYLSISVDELLGKENPATQNVQRVAEDIEFFNLYQSAPDDIRAAVLTILRNGAGK